MSYDSVEILDAFSRRAGITYPLLADPDYKIIDAFGIVNTGVPKENPYYGFAYAGYYLIDADGKVVEKYFGEDNNDRSTAKRILVQQYGAEADGQGTATTPHLAARWSSSDSELVPGQRSSLVLEVKLPEGMHVYAPGVDGYIAVDWQVTAIDGVELADVDYPEGKVKHLPAIDESVPIYEGEVRLVRDVRLLGSRDLPESLTGKDELVVEGTFRYQACDADECYFPETLPLKWTFALEPHDLERVPAEIRRVDETE